MRNAFRRGIKDGEVVGKVSLRRDGIIEEYRADKRRVRPRFEQERFREAGREEMPARHKA